MGRPRRGEGGEVTARDLIDGTDIEAIWTALGGAPLRHGRGKAFWRDGDGFNVSVNADRNIYYDHRDGVGGGVLDLIRAVLDCDKRAAIHWLADQQGVTLDDNRLTPSERRAWAQKRARAERDSDKLTARRQGVIDDLRARRNRAWDDERTASRLALRMIREGRDDSPSWEIVWRHAFDDRRGDALDRELRCVEALSPSAFRLAVTG